MPHLERAAVFCLALLTVPAVGHAGDIEILPVDLHMRPDQDFVLELTPRFELYRFFSRGDSAEDGSPLPPPGRTEVVEYDVSQLYAVGLDAVLGFRPYEGAPPFGLQLGFELSGLFGAEGEVEAVDSASGALGVDDVLLGFLIDAVADWFDVKASGRYLRFPTGTFAVTDTASGLVTEAGVLELEYAFGELRYDYLSFPRIQLGMGLRYDRYGLPRIVYDAREPPGQPAPLVATDVDLYSFEPLIAYTGIPPKLPPKGQRWVTASVQLLIAMGVGVGQLRWPQRSATFLSFVGSLGAKAELLYLDHHGHAPFVMGFEGRGFGFTVGNFFGDAKDKVSLSTFNDNLFSMQVYMRLSFGG